VQVLPLFVAAHAIQLVVRMLAGGVFPGWTVFLTPFVEALLWPVISVVLLLPQLRAHDPDENRPL
jgi:rod shape-determining protein MreD